MRKLFKNLALGIALLCLNITVFSAVKLPAIISDNMVLQQGRPAPIWGWADPGEKVTVRLDNHSASAETDAQGAWRVVLEPLKTDGKCMKIF